MKVKMILPALTEARSPYYRPLKYSLFPPLGLATLAGYLSPSDEVTLQDEHVEPLELDDTPDLVVIECYVTSAYRSYQLAEHYRTRGAHVCLGGLHPTSLPAEAARFADAVFCGLQVRGATPCDPSKQARLEHRPQPGLLQVTAFEQLLQSLPEPGPPAGQQRFQELPPVEAGHVTLGPTRSSQGHHDMRRALGGKGQAGALRRAHTEPLGVGCPGLVYRKATPREVPPPGRLGLHRGSSPVAQQTMQHAYEETAWHLPPLSAPLASG